MELDVEGARRAMEEKVAGPLGFDAVEASAAIHDIVNGHMSDLIRGKVVTSGRMPEDFVLYVYGGAGPVHAAGFAAELGISSVYVFPTSPVFSSTGISLADYIQTRLLSRRLVMPVEPDALNDMLADVEDDLTRAMERQGFARDDLEFGRRFFMRYRRQLHELEVPVATKRYDDTDVKEIMDFFEQRYEEVYGEGTSYRQAGIELLSVHVDAVGPAPKPSLQAEDAVADARPEPKGERRVRFSGTTGLDTPVYEFDRVPGGSRIDGPAIIETPITTVVVPPGHETRVDAYRNLVLRRLP
jgi:N-methylhydantoinase A